LPALGNECSPWLKGNSRLAEIVLVDGHGGVAFVRLADRRRWRSAIVVSRSAEKLESARAWAPNAFDRSFGSLVEAVYRLTADHGAAHISNLVGGANLG